MTLSIRNFSDYSCFVLLQFVYDSEKPTVVNELLHEIHRGVQLRHTKTNDRSRPDFNKLGQFT